MKISKPLWAQGIFMTPQHFQQQSLWERFARDPIARIGSSEPWGISRVSFDLSSLSIGRLQLLDLAMVFADGTPIDARVADRLPPARDMSSAAHIADSLIVHIGLPLMDAQGGNCAEPDDSPTRPRRFVREYSKVTDLLGEGEEELSVERHALMLLFEFEDLNAFVTCPIARLARNVQGRFEVDPEFVPPCLLLSASETLIAQMDRLTSILGAKSTSLAARRRERADQIADYAVSDVSLFWLLHSVNSAWPELAHLCNAPDQHPDHLYRALSRLAGSLLTFSTTETLQSIPAYDHVSPGPVFAALETLIRTLLDTVIPSRVVPVALERVRPTMWLGLINDERLAEGADFYLSVRASVTAQTLADQLPRLCKAGAPDDVEQIVNSALPGIPLRAHPRLPHGYPGSGRRPLLRAG